MKKLPEEKIRAAAQWLEEASRLLRGLSDVSEALSAALNESCRVKAALSRCKYPCDLEELLKLIASSDEFLAAKLQDCDFERFELGKLHITAPDAQTWVQLHMHKDSLAGLLEEFYKVPFKIKVKEK